MRLLYILGLSVFLFSSCNRYYVEIHRQRINAGYLASTSVNTPDPRRCDPPLGEMLVIEWLVSMEIMEKNPQIRLYAISWDNEERVYTWPIKKRKGYRTFSVLNDDFIRTGGLLTYRAEIITEDGEVFREWKHQMWVNLIKAE